MEELRMISNMIAVAMEHARICTLVDVGRHSRYIRLADAKRLVTEKGYKASVIKRWEDAGLLHRRKDKTKASNASVYYDTTELMTAITTTKIQKHLITRQ